jgi:hypothetical protein
MTDRDTEPQVLKSRLLADLVQAMSSGHPLQATAVGILLGRTAYDMVQQALKTKEHGGAPVDQRLQLHLRNVVTVLSVAERHFGSVLLAIHWYRSNRLDEGLQRTPEALTVAGRLEDAYRLLLRTPTGGGGEAR